MLRLDGLDRRPQGRFLLDLLPLALPRLEDQIVSGCLSRYL